jgi:hypothetical protein
MGPGTGQTQLERPPTPDRSAPVLPADEELLELVRHIRTDEHTATDVTTDVDQERMPDAGE